MTKEMQEVATMCCKEGAKHSGGVDRLCLGISWYKSENKKGEQKKAYLIVTPNMCFAVP